jgi:dihydrofolate synthase/folylpolyglutamate synthase
VGETYLVIGVLDGREPAELLETLDAASAALVICCASDSPRALAADDLAAIVRAHGGDAVTTPTVGAAVALALERAEADDVILVTGSLHTVGAARAACRAFGFDVSTS